MSQNVPLKVKITPCSAVHKFTVDVSDKDVRIDVCIMRVLVNVVPSRMFVQRIAEAGRLIVNGRVVKASYRLVPGDQVVFDVRYEDYPDDQICPEDIKLEVVWEDDDLVAINKPAGMTVHPAAGHCRGTLVNALKFYYGELSDLNGEKRPGIVHRLDKETSGIILAARNNSSHVSLAAQFEARTVEKKYVALVEGVIQFDEGLINAAIAPHPKFHDMRRIARENEQGKAAETFYAVIRRFPKVTAVALYPGTGRTHQLRLHMRHIGHAILGDDKYGNKGNFSRMALHAQSVAFDHPRTNARLELSVPLPAEFLDFI